MSGGLDEILNNSQQGLGWAFPVFPSILIGDPQNANTQITAQLPAELAAKYAFATQISRFVITMSPDGVGYHYQLVATYASNTGYIYAEGWVNHDLTVVEFMNEKINKSGNSFTDLQWGGNSTNAFPFHFQFGSLGLGQTVPNTFKVANSTVTFGADVSDVGSVVFTVPQTVTGNVANSAALNTFSGSDVKFTGSTIEFAGPAVDVNSAWNFDQAPTYTHNTVKRSMGLGIIDGVLVTTTGAITAAVSADTEVVNLRMTQSVVVAGRRYRIAFQIYCTLSVATDKYQVTIWLGGFSLGTQLVVLVQPGTGSGAMYGEAYWTALVDGSQGFAFSIQRNTGTGTVTAQGSPGGGIGRTQAFVEDVSDGTWWRVA